jgi:hypothetical protein
MGHDWRAALGSQFGAAIDMLENTVRACPDDLWRGREAQPGLWSIVHHTLFWLDLYLSGSVEGFAPPAPFGLEELDPAGRLPERPYSKDELLAYLEHSRAKCRRTIGALTEEKARQRCSFSWGEVSFSELLLCNMRHGEEHAGGLSDRLGQVLGSGPGWVAKARTSLRAE